MTVSGELKGRCLGLSKSSELCWSGNKWARQREEPRQAGGLQLGRARWRGH